MQLNSHNLKFCLVIIIWSLVIRPSFVQAAETTLSVSPPVTEILLAPGKSVSQTFSLKSTTPGLTLTPELHLAKPSDDSGHITIDPSPLNQTTLPLTINMSGPSISPTLTFQASNIDTSQDLYLAIVFQASPSSPLSLDNTSVALPAISSLILISLNPSGVIPIDLEVTSFTIPYLHDSWGPLTITPLLKNNSPVMIRPIGKYEIISPSGKISFTRALYPSLILSDSVRRILGTDHCDLQRTDPCQILPLTWSPPWYAIGPYRLHLTITSLGGTKITDVEKVIWVLPIRLLIISALILIFSLTLISKSSKFKPI